MNLRFSSLIRNPASSSSSPHADQPIVDDNNEATVNITPHELLKVKRVDFYYSRWTKSWKYRNTSPRSTVETAPIMHSTTNDAWKEFSFVIVRTIPRQEDAELTFKLVVKSEYLLKACKTVIQSWPGISWNSDPLELNLEIFITFHSNFLKYASQLQAKRPRSDEESNMLFSVNLLTSTIALDYKAVLTEIEQLTSNGEISFDLLYAILIPLCLMVTRCYITGLPRLFQLISWIRTSVEGMPIYELSLQSVDLVDRPLTQGVVVGKVHTIVYIKPLRGVFKINKLDAYPLKFHSDPEGLKQKIMMRGKKWVSLIGVHHKQFDGVAALKAGDKILKHIVRSRIMVDRATFRRLNPKYILPTPVPLKMEDGSIPSHFGQQYDPFGNPLPEKKTPFQGLAANLIQIQATDATPDVEVTDEDLLLTPTVVFGFSLSDKVWLELNVEIIQNIDWARESFTSLVLPSDKKHLLQSLVKAHREEVGNNGFIRENDRGLVINLFGPPGVGKMFCAEAVSEHVQSPLYVICGGDLGTTAASLESTLETFFDVATSWRAIVLIDKADVLLEQRSLHDLEQDAMVAAFLRHVRYYPGIVFVSTNRVKAFHEAFLSHIHLALRFPELTQESKEQIWTALIAKTDGRGRGVTEGDITKLAKWDINGRQIKNVVRMAHSLAVTKGEEMNFEHLKMIIDALDEISSEFEKRSL